MFEQSVMTDYFVELKTHNEVYSCDDNVLYCCPSVYYRFITYILLVMKNNVFSSIFLNIYCYVNSLRLIKIVQISGQE